MQKVFPHCKANNPFTKAIFAALTAAFLLLLGCGDSDVTSDQKAASRNTSEQAAIPDYMTPGSAVSDSSSASNTTLHYRITQRTIPDPKTDFENNPENQNKNYFSSMMDADFAASPCADANVALFLEDSFCSDETLYFLYHIIYQSDDLSSYELSGGLDFVYTDSFLLYVLEPPYEQWQCHTLSSSGWTITGADGVTSAPMISSIAGVGNSGVYFYTPERVLLFYSLDGSYRCLDGIDLDAYFQPPSLYSAGETLYVVGSDVFSNSSFSSYGKDLQLMLTQNLTNAISGCIIRNSEYLWYGFDEENNLTVWDRPNGTALFSLGKMVRSFADFRLTRSDDGQFLLADISGVWTGDGSTPLQKILSFSETGYDLQELLTVSKAEDNSLTVIAYFEDSLCLLALKQADRTDKQEITLVTSASIMLERVTAAFNRQSSEYRVVLVNPFDSDDIEAYCRQLQMEISTGGGPDLMESWLLDWEGCIKNGYVEPLDDVIEDPSDYWPVLLKDSKTDGSIYSLPDSYNLSFLAVSKSLAGGLDSWTLEQMVKAVKNSPAETLQMGINSMDIVLQYGLADRGNTQFIDYEAGASHLAEQPFLDFLAFAKKYGDNMYYTGDRLEEAVAHYQDGRLAVLYVDMDEVADFLFASTLFQDQEVLIGMPAAEGRGVYVSSNQFCLNSNSPSKTGAKDFLRYLLSAEGQLTLLRNENAIMGFSVRRDVTEFLLNEYQEHAIEQEKRGGTYDGFYRWGFLIEKAPFTDEQIGQFMALFEDARPQPWIPSELKSIIQDELAPFFAGDCSAEEAARKLDNRVQLYLDEFG